MSLPTQPSTAAQPDNATLTAWLQRAAEGDQTAFRRLAQALGQRMFALAFRLTGNNHATAEDVVQEVLVKLWQAAPNWQPEKGHSGSVSAYVSRLVYTTAMDHHRRQSPLTRTLADTGLDALPDVPVPETATTRLLEAEQRQWLLKGLQQLPERQQQAVILSYFHAHQQRDVATALGTTEKAVESLLVRARRTLATLVPASLSPNSHP